MLQLLQKGGDPFSKSQAAICETQLLVGLIREEEHFDSGGSLGGRIQLTATDLQPKQSDLKQLTTLSYTIPQIHLRMPAVLVRARSAFAEERCVIIFYY